MTSHRPDPFDSPYFRQHSERMAKFDRDFDKTERRIFIFAGLAGVVTLVFYLLLIAAMVLGVVWLWGQVR